jgi:predicted CopG family antitoxin
MSATDDSATEQIRVSARVKSELERLKRGSESFNDVLTRVLDDERDVFAGFGILSDEEADAIRETIERGEEKSRSRMQELREQ